MMIGKYTYLTLFSFIGPIYLGMYVQYSKILSSNKFFYRFSEFRIFFRWAHEGTLEYTSRDSHIGCTSRRGDIEVLVYNLIEWWGGSLPWDRDIANAIGVKNAKFRAFTNPHKFLR